MTITTREGLYQKFLGLRPLNVMGKFRDSSVGLVSGRDIAAVMKKNNSIVMATNIRNPLSIWGVLRAAKKADAAVMLELAKSEDSYTAVHYHNMPALAERYSAEIGHGVIFGLHMDHFAVKSAQERDQAIGIIKTAVDEGWTSVAIDASHNPDWENLIYTRDVAMNIPLYVGLEVEVGEIKGPGVLSTVEEAEYFVGGLNSWAVFPDFLAISNGSMHGTYDKSTGLVESIDLNRTKEIADHIAQYGVVIAQHGISGTPFDKVGTFKQYGIFKGNVGTLWQNILFGLKLEENTGNPILEGGSYVKDPDRGISDELWAEMVAWADSKSLSRKSGDYKKANAPFNDKILALEKKYIDRILEETESWAARFFNAFRCEGTGKMVMEHILARGDYNSAPEVRIIARRENYTRTKAPDFHDRKDGPKGDFSD
jgi:fructose/tagatose bisphosphate aldolase